MLKLNSTVWILAIGRLLSQIGKGFTLFYAPIFFVDGVGLSSTQVGFALGSASISGVIARFAGGEFTDSPYLGRKGTLLLSGAISAVADVVLALTYNFPTLVIGNLLMGLGIGFYWPATEAAITDLTSGSQRNSAFALTRFGDSLGLGIGVILGGIWIAKAANYRALFIIDGISFVVFFLIVYFAISETYHHPSQSQSSSASQSPSQSQSSSESQSSSQKRSSLKQWKEAFRDEILMIFVLVNIIFTTYIAQIHTTLPLFLKKFVDSNDFTATTMSSLFTWHIFCAAIFQLPMVAWLKRFRNPTALQFSLLFWGVGFIFVWLTGILTTNLLIMAILAMAVLAIALVAYTPFASSFVADLAPSSNRGVYLAINSQCWAIGYFIGPIIGGWALDQSQFFINYFWLGTAFTIVIGIFILEYLKNFSLKQNK